jgi:hypothetical protein
MNIRQAILSAADSIEQQPDSYKFSAIGLPDCGSPACALGWIGHHLGFSMCLGDIINRATKIISGKENHTEFYRQMEGICDRRFFSKWTTTEIADGLRLFADKYHPEKDYIPASVRAIFDESQAACLSVG